MERSAFLFRTLAFALIALPLASCSCNEERRARPRDAGSDAEPRDGDGGVPDLRDATNLPDATSERAPAPDVVRDPDATPDARDAPSDAPTDGDGRDAAPPPVIDGVYPSANPSGAGVLIVGNDLAEVSSVRIGGLDVPPTYNDGFHVVIELPQVAVGTTSLALVTNDGRRSAARAFEVLTAFPPGPNGPDALVPLSPVGLLPPISNRWVNEFDPADDRYLLSDSCETTHPSLTVLCGGSLGPPHIDGALDPATGRVTLNIRDSDSGVAERYVGLFSQPDESYLSRIVLFPDAPGGRLLVIGRCDDSLAEDEGATCP